MKKILLILGIITCYQISFSQHNDSLRKALYYIDSYQIKLAEEATKHITDKITKQLISLNISHLKQNYDYKAIPDSENGSPIAKFLIYTLYGDRFLNMKPPKDSLAFDKYKKALQYSFTLNDSLLIRFSLKKIIKLLYKNRKVLDISSNYLDIYENYATDNNSLAFLIFYRSTIKGAIVKKEQIDHYKEGLLIAKKSSNKFIQGKYNQLIGVHFSYFLKQSDSAFKYYEKASDIFKKEPYAIYQNEMFGIYANTGILFSEIKKYNKANQFYQKAIQTKSFNNNLLNMVKLTDLIAQNYKNLKETDSTFYYYDLNKKYLDSLNEYRKAIAVNDLDKKYQTAEKEKQILIEQQKRKRNQNIALGLGGSLFLGSIIAILIYKNTKRKQHIAEQEREIEIQKTEKLFKEQELAAIDAMISGQEKERQRLAHDLHDNLGSTLATVKLHFDHLKNNRDNPKAENIEELYNKTNHLLDEAYQKVRTIAHEKNGGVIAKQGLLPAVKNLAKKASNGDRLQIEVQDYGLDERLDNALEISIFRIIQELITNTIKHANASEIHISLTNHDSLLNIIVEDNGKGFDAKILPKKDGMGLKSIEKRIEHMEGTFEIDSTIEKGTNIIINVPI